MENIRKKQIKNLFNNFIDIMGFYGIWFSGIKGYGKYKKWFDNRQLKINAYYKNNMKIKEYKRWYYNGQLEILCYYNEKGELDGICKKWDYNGNLVFEIKFKNNELVSINYVDLDYSKIWFNYYDQIQDDYISFYDKIKEIYNNGKHKKKTN